MNLPNPNPAAAVAAEAASESLTWTRRFWCWFSLFLVVRTGFAAFFPLDFAGDEAYYWDWGRRLDWGYYSKPPMVAWLMALGSWLGNDSFLVIKLIPIVLIALGTWTLFILTRTLYGARAGFWAATLLMATPATAALSILLTIDPPLFLFWGLSLYWAWRWLEAPPNFRSGLWPSVALATALGCGYLSKPIQLLFPLMLILFLALSPADRWRLRRPGTYLTLLASLCFLLPVVRWNVRHDWITFAHTAHHFESPDLRWTKLLARPLEFAGSQIGLCSPIVWLLLVVGLFAVARRWSGAGRPERFLFCFSAPMLAAVHLMSLWQRVHPNWPLVFYLSGFVLLGGLAARRLPAQVANPRYVTWFKPALVVALILAFMAYAATFVLPHTPWAGVKGDPTERLRGWRELGQAVGRTLSQLPEPDRTLIITPSRRQLASQLAYYLPTRPRVYRLENPARINSQYGIWGGPPADTVGQDALLVMEGGGQDPLPPELLAAFESVRGLPPVVVPLGPRAPARTVRLWHATGFRGWPYPPLR